MLVKVADEWKQQKQEKNLSKLPAGAESLDIILQEMKDILK